MKFFLGVILIALLSAAAEFILPWWVVAAVSFVVSLVLGLRPGRSFLMGFLGVGLCWLAFAMMRDSANEHILSNRMAALFHLPNYGLFIGVIVLIGALVGGMSAWAGGLLTSKR